MINLISYIDPGSTALVWQILAGVLIAFGVVLGIWWTKITTFFKSVWAKLFGKKNKKGDDNASDELLDELSDTAPEDSAAEDEDDSDKNDKISA